MSKRSYSRATLLALTSAFLFTFCISINAQESASKNVKSDSTKISSRMATFDDATGDTKFALALQPKFQSTKAAVSEVLVYVDTSASQSGVFREDSLSFVNALFEQLGDKDRVRLFAVDLDPVEMTKGFVAPNSLDIQKAMKKLAKRAPLGATDFIAMFRHSCKSFSSKKLLLPVHFVPIRLLKNHLVWSLIPTFFLSWQNIRHLLLFEPK